MANFNKAFNFRGGFQVDTDVLVVRGQSVGIGSSIPTERLDVDGTIKANGLKIDSTEAVELETATAGIISVTNYLTVGTETPNPNSIEFPFVRPEVLITTGIVTSANPSAGVVTYYGDGAQLLNLPTSQWLDIDVGLGFTSIYAQGYVGVDTTDPRYVFQVGGVPYAPKAGFQTSQTGVGIETGSIWASNNISVGGSVTAEGEFVGVGSLLVGLDADNILYGTISSDRYGNINAGIVSVGILTASQYVSSPVFIGSTFVGDTFSGIAQTAVGVLTTAQLDFDTAVANEFKARDRFISTEGKLQIGDFQNENIGAGASVGDVDVYRFDETSYIYSLSNTSNAKIFVGKERAGSTRRRFGGLRYGGSTVDSTSGGNDLDVVNYDVGNLNFYLHSGSGGLTATEGAFQWIYGQNDNILASLSKDGKFSLTGNPLTGESTLEVSGIATFKDEVYIDGNVNVGGATTLTGDLTVDGIISINGGVEAEGDLQLKGAEFSGNVVVTDGLDYVAIGTAGILTATTEIQMVGSSGTSVQLRSDGTISATSTIQTNTDVIAGGQVTAPNINASTQLTAPSNFRVDAGGLRVDSAVVGVLTITTAELDNISVSDLEVTSDFTHSSGSVTINSGGITATTLTATDVNSVNVTATGTISAGSYTITSSLANLPEINADTIDVTGTVTTDSLIADTITVDSITYTSTTINVPDIIASDISANNITASGTVTAVGLNAANLTVSSINGQPTFNANVNVNGGIEATGIVTCTLLDTTAVTAETVDASFNVSTVAVDAPAGTVLNLTSDIAVETNVETIVPSLQVTTGQFNLGGVPVTLGPNDMESFDISFNDTAEEIVIFIRYLGSDYVAKIAAPYQEP